ncbi:MAG: sulfatase-like hydrolase/transferase [Planctomycetes bacterium]|nr:sulfatase-like hydrolase/transferase [Planctomycetota bacterium]MCB9891728.1 sulfatase-like hydrolase/transferase [Planctomycetota bacterium]
MTRRLVWSFIFAMSGFASAQDAPRPNILFLFTDDHAQHAISAYGSRINETPNLDRLAREGMLFKNAFVTNSICAPARAVILTGKLSHLNGIMTNAETFDGSQDTFPKRLQAAGYQTAMLGKWHLKSAPTGFDFWKVLRGQGTYYNPRLRTPDGDQELTGYTTDLITDEALTWLREGRDPEKPFLLMLQHKAPHREWAPGPKHLALYDDVTLPEPDNLFDDWATRTRPAHEQSMTIARHLTQRDLKFVPPRNLTAEQLATWNAAYGPKNRAFEDAHLEGDDLVRWKYQRYIKDYLRCIAAVDEAIGRVLDYLDESGLAQNTIVMYSSDQGFYLGDHGWFDKRWMYEESLRTPLIVRWPGKVDPGTVNEDLVQNVDYAPTFLEAAGVEVPETMQGRSLVALMGKDAPVPAWRDSIYYHYYEFPGAHDVAKHEGVRNRRYKLMHFYEVGTWEFYDLEKDPREMRNAYGDSAYRDTIDAMKRELARLRTQYQVPDPMEAIRAARERTLESVSALETQLAFTWDGKTDEFPRLDPTRRAITVGASVTLEGRDGVIVCDGGESQGFALYVKEGRPAFVVRVDGTAHVVRSPLALEPLKTHHVVGVLGKQGRLRLYVDGRLHAEGPGRFLTRTPADGMDVMRDSGSLVGSYGEENALAGKVENLRIYWGEVPVTDRDAWMLGTQ